MQWKKTKIQFRNKRNSLNISSVSEADSGGCKKDPDLVYRNIWISECLRKFTFKKISNYKEILEKRIKQVQWIINKNQLKKKRNSLNISNVSEKEFELMVYQIQVKGKFEFQNI